MDPRTRKFSRSPSCPRFQSAPSVSGGGIVANLVLPERPVGSARADDPLRGQIIALAGSVQGIESFRGNEDVDLDGFVRLCAEAVELGGIDDHVMVLSVFVT
jgi:hypothetical protein